MLGEMAQSSHQHLWPGAPLALGAAALFGASTPLAKLLLVSIDPWLMAGLLYLGSGLGLCTLIATRNILRLTTEEAPLTRKDFPWLAGTVLFGGIIGPLLLLFGLGTTDAASASLLLNLEAVFTLLLAWIVFREHADRSLIIGAMAIVAGALLLSWRGNIGSFSWGAVLIALACLAWAIDNNLTRKISATDPFVLAAIKGVFAGSVNTAAAFASFSLWPNATTGQSVSSAVLLSVIRMAWP